MNKYINDDLNNPKYLFHGSPKLLDTIKKHQAHDSNGNAENEDYAVFLTSSYIIASAYAFKDRIKEDSKDLNWNFEIGYNYDNKKEQIIFENVNIDENIEGYIYVFNFNPSYGYSDKSIQYKCYEDIKPIDVIKVKLSDFVDNYEIYNSIKHIQ